MAAGSPVTVGTVIQRLLQALTTVMALYLTNVVLPSGHDATRMAVNAAMVAVLTIAIEYSAPVLDTTAALCLPWLVTAPNVLHIAAVVDDASVKTIDQRFLRLAVLVSSLASGTVGVVTTYMSYGSWSVPLSLSTKPHVVPSHWLPPPYRDHVVRIAVVGEHVGDKRATTWSAHSVTLLSATLPTEALDAVATSLAARSDVDVTIASLRSRCRHVSDLDRRIDAEAVFVTAADGISNDPILAQRLQTLVCTWMTAGAVTAVQQRFGGPFVLRPHVPTAVVSERYSLLAEHDLGVGYGTISVYVAASEKPAPNGNGSSTDGRHRLDTMAILSSHGRSGALDFVRTYLAAEGTPRHYTLVGTNKKDDPLAWSTAERADYDATGIATSVQRAVLDDVRSFDAIVKRVGTKHGANRRSYLLHGPAGTGKSTLGLVVATQLQCSAATLNMELIDGPRQLQAATLALTEKLGATTMHVVIVEDLDRSAWIKAMLADASDQTDGIGTLLNWLDGSAAAQNRIVVVSVNDYGLLERLNARLDGALLRHGRFDVIVEVGACDGDQLCDLFWYLTRADDASLTEAKLDRADVDGRLRNVASARPPTTATVFSLFRGSHARGLTLLENLEAAVPISSFTNQDWTEAPNQM
jgi:hypothetical protein